MHRANRGIVLMVLGMFLFPWNNYGQEPEQESAALSLELYTDAFQESFFEGLKQKGIGNYDKAVKAFLECQEMQPGMAVVDHELARLYLEQNAFVQAKEAALAAVSGEPGNPWYIQTLVRVQAQQGLSVALLKDRLPWSDPDFKEKLALALYREGQFRESLEILQGLRNSEFRALLQRQLEDSLSLGVPGEIEEEAVEDNPQQQSINELNKLIETSGFIQLESAAAEHLESYPANPFFYYAYGLALQRNGKNKEAIGVLEEGLDYLLDDPKLEVKFFRELASAYQAVGDSVKANMYLSKTKKGS
ncbi:tetratricopeptide repeat protein [Zeaxanthinibacter enoshimensis]|uniref:Uncharacterized protein n=1 Tax=Zeaxanthinibacter enoshimensis TaxID=392009 RepID=A0A4R6TUX4_9FLAO|nr:hypothetical protein [Zeaxanthinibacter enoshimensis]TDQ32738.1 hypothetical protein CLV82_0571 [Zeaxanthinibacter enoshimensis]